MTKRPLVLASTSPYRRRLLERLQVPFSVAAPNIEEAPRPAEDPIDLVRRLSTAKAAAVAAHHPGALIIGSDQVGCFDGRLLNKPLTRSAAADQLRSMSNRCVEFHSGICLLDATAGGRCEDVVTTRVHFRELAPATIDDYLDREDVLDCAGSFKVEGLGISLFTAIESSDPTALEGLPLIRLCDFLLAHG